MTLYHIMFVIIFIMKFQTKKIVTFINRLFVYIDMSKYVSIGVKRQTKEKLKKEFRPRETWDDLLNRLVEDAKGGE